LSFVHAGGGKEGRGHEGAALLCCHAVERCYAGKRRFLSGLRKTRFFKKKKNNKQPTQVFLKKKIFCFYLLKKQVFVLILRKIEKTHSELFLLHHATSPSLELHNTNLLYQSWHSKLGVKKCTPSLFSQSVVGQLTPKW